jgi:hypothetical protein
MNPASAREFSAVVADITLESRTGLQARWLMALDPAGFALGETGTLHAVTRTGASLEIPVLDVIGDERDVLWCVVEKPLAAGTDVLAKPHSQP